MPKVTVYVTLKPSLLDAQGRTIESALNKMGHGGVSQVRVGKIIEMNLTGTVAEARQEATRMCDRLLANPVMESYKIEVTE
jgi:phosphoribosylformylglycinamidine synthase